MYKLDLEFTDSVLLCNSRNMNIDNFKICHLDNSPLGYVTMVCFAGGYQHLRGTYCPMPHLLV